MVAKVGPSLFYGTAVSAALGLALGLALHGPWQSDRPAPGPQLLISTAQAAEAPPRPRDTESEPTQYIDPGPLPPNPLPVTRLTATGGDPLPASADEERVTVDDVAPDPDSDE
jgi:hypothetical protein